MTTTPYELLARFNKDGTIAGAHVRTLTTNADGDEFEGKPIPLASATDPAFIAFAEQFAAGAVAERDTLRTQKADLQSSLAARTSELEAMTQARDTELAAKVAAQEQVQSLTTQLSEANAAKTTAESALAQAETARDNALSRVTELEGQLDAILHPVSPPLTASLIFERSGNRFYEMLAANRDDALLLGLFIRMAAATKPIDKTQTEVAQGIAYLLNRGYATQAELDAWFAPVGS